MQDIVTQRVTQFLHQTPILDGSNFLHHHFSDPAKKDMIWDLIPKLNDRTISTAPLPTENNPFSDTYMHLLLYVRNLFKHVYTTVEGTEQITQKSWASSPASGLQGGGVMTVLRGDILEKSAVNMSVVAGHKYPGLNTTAENDKKYVGRPFAAAGVSVISHPKNPFAPIVHFNIRVLKVFGEDQVYQWMGGGADLTPMQAFSEDTNEFHDMLKDVCQKHSDVANYDHFQKWADEYFYIPHRKEIRGVGGIFFDYLPISSDTDTNFLFDLGQSVPHVYANILSRRVHTEYNDELVKKHHFWRGRYAEFNLAYDRGTRFGLMSGGNHEAIFCSLPPQVCW